MVPLTRLEDSPTSPQRGEVKRRVGFPPLPAGERPERRFAGPGEGLCATTINYCTPSGAVQVCGVVPTPSSATTHRHPRWTPHPPQYTIHKYTIAVSGSSRRVRPRTLRGRAVARAGVRVRLGAHRFRVRNRWGSRASRPATRTCGGKRTRPVPGLAPRSDPIRPRAPGVPRIIAGSGINGAAAHPLIRPQLAAKNDGDHCRVFRSFSAPTPTNPSGSGDHRKKIRGPSLSGAGFPAIPSGLRCRRATSTGAKRCHLGAIRAHSRRPWPHAATITPRPIRRQTGTCGATRGRPWPPPPPGFDATACDSGNFGEPGKRNAVPARSGPVSRPFQAVSAVGARPSPAQNGRQTGARHAETGQRPPTTTRPNPSPHSNPARACCQCSRPLR